MIFPLQIIVGYKLLSRAQNPQRNTAMSLLEGGALVRLRDFQRAGVSPETLSRLVREGVAIRQARGLYQLTDATVDARHTLAEASALTPKAVVCLTSALQFHELTLQMPSAVWMAIDRTAWKPHIEYPPIHFVRFSPKALSEGVEHHAIEGISVPVFTPAKTIVDCFRYRNKIGLDVALEGLRSGLRSRKVTPDQIWQFARDARIWPIIKPYLEAMVVDGV